MGTRIQQYLAPALLAILLGGCATEEQLRTSDVASASVADTSERSGEAATPTAAAGAVDPTWPGSYEGSLEWKVEGDAMDVRALLVLRPDGHYTLTHQSWSYKYQNSGSYEANGDGATLYIPAGESISGEAIACELTRKKGELWGLGPCMGWHGLSGGDEMPFRNRPTS